MSKWIFLLFGTIAGGFARYGLAGLVYSRMGTSFPHGTMVVNLSGCLLIGLVDGLAKEKFLLGPNARLLLMTGFCGAFTTFSTFMLETTYLIKDGEFAQAFLNVVVSLVGGIILFLTGSFMAKTI